MNGYAKLLKQLHRDDEAQVYAEKARALKQGM
jgi:hypothetical protein